MWVCAAIICAVEIRWMVLPTTSTFDDGDRRSDVLLNMRTLSKRTPAVWVSCAKKPARRMAAISAAAD
jgi:hypothetical protein